MLISILITVGYATITGGTFRTKSRAFAAPVTGLTLPGVSSSIPPVDQSTLRPPTINKTQRNEQPVSQQQQAAAAQVRASFVTPTAEPSPTPAAAVEEDAIVRAASVAPTPIKAAYQVYEVKDGDTVSSIAAKFGIDAKYVIANNVEIRDSDFLKLGQSIIVPADNGILYEVRYGETLSDISTKFNVDVGAIAAYPSNGITTPDNIKELQTVFVPNGAIPVAAPVVQPAISPTDAAASATPAPAAGTTDRDGSSSGGRGSSGPASSAGLIWPVRGSISSYYGASHALGIDIDGYNLVGSPVAAATSGTVVFAGGNACCSYGLYVVILSPAGIETTYAHLSSIAVSQGETLTQGDSVGIIGNTGYSTGTHLHFEVVDNGVRQNPLNYLP